MQINKLKEVSVSKLLNSESLIPFDQPEIEMTMRKLLLDAGVTDVAYEGSNISQLTAVISYVIASLNVNTAINIQETILPLATKRMNILLGARQLGYEAHAQKSYQYKIKLHPHYDASKVYPDTIIDDDGNVIPHPQAGDIDIFNQEKRHIPLHQNTKFQSGDNVYYYRGPSEKSIFHVSNWDISNQLLSKENTNVAPQDETMFTQEILVEEGELITYDPGIPDVEYDVTLEWPVREYTDEDGLVKPQQDFIIPHHDVEDDGLQVFVKSIDYTKPPIGGVYQYERIQWQKSKHFLIDKSFNEEKHTFIRMENIILQYPTIFFEYSGMGTGVKSGDIIQVNVFKSKGENGAAHQKFEVMNTVASELFYADKRFKLHRKGGPFESAKSIKTNATVFNNTASRAVTRLDYMTITKGHPKVKSVYAWGGEDERPRKLGHIYVSTAPHFEKEYKYFPPIKAQEAKSEVPGKNLRHIPNPNYDPSKPSWPAVSEDLTRTPPVKYQAAINPKLIDNPKYDPKQPSEPLIPAQKAVAEQKERYELIIGTPEPGKVHYNTAIPTDLDNWYQNEIIAKDIMTYLEYYKIITMRLHHRQPLYVDFEYEIDVVKYDMSQSRTDINEKVFNALLEYFVDQIEGFDSEYINSNMQRILDIVLTFQSGLSFTLQTWGVLYKNMKNMYNEDNPHTTSETIKFILAYPYEDMFKAKKLNPKFGQPGEPEYILGYLDVDLLPKMDTPKFGLGKKPLIVKTDPLKDLHKGDKEASCNIEYDGQGCGTYIVNNEKSWIEVELAFSTAQADEIFGNNYGGHGDYARFELRYPYTNKYSHSIPFTKNVIPRLKTVIFKDN